MSTMLLEAFGDPAVMRFIGRGQTAERTDAVEQIDVDGVVALRMDAFSACVRPGNQPAATRGCVGRGRGRAQRWWRRPWP